MPAALATAFFQVGQLTCRNVVPNIRNMFRCAPDGTVCVKICGLTRPEDAVEALSSGADALGMIFAPSRRRVSLEEARRVAGVVRGGALLFGVFVDEDPARIVETCRAVPLDVVQLHGNEPPEILADLPGIRAVKALRVRDDRVLEELPRYARFDAVLLDTWAEASPGGTGETFDWAVAASAARRARVILAGGLTPCNVAEAVRRVRPYMVDASSGVESSPGRKDPSLVREFVRAAKTALAAEEGHC